MVVILRHYGDLSYAEIAEIMDLPLGTVKSRLNTAMQRMRHDLESDFPCPARTVTIYCRSGCNNSAQARCVAATCNVAVNRPVGAGLADP